VDRLRELGDMTQSGRIGLGESGDMTQFGRIELGSCPRILMLTPYCTVTFTRSTLGSRLASGSVTVSVTL